MNIAILGGYQNSFSLAVVVKLLQQGYRVSTFIITKSNRKKNAIAAIAKLEFWATIAEKLKNLIHKKTQNAGSANTFTKDYLRDLKVSHDTNLKKVMEENHITPFLVNSINEEKCLVYMRSIRPDIIIYTGGGIVRKKLIEIPRVGILNAHMGLLPYYKGMNVLEWAVFNNDPIGITVHFIDTGVDTGDILLKREIQINKESSLQALRTKAVSVSVDAIAEVVGAINNNSVSPQKQKKDGRQYYVMHEKLKNLVNERLKKNEL